jgi:hypothetical protein
MLWHVAVTITEAWSHRQQRQAAQRNGTRCSVLFVGARACVRACLVATACKWRPCVLQQTEKKRHYIDETDEDEAAPAPPPPSIESAKSAPSAASKVRCCVCRAVYARAVRAMPVTRCVSGGDGALPNPGRGCCSSLRSRSATSTNLTKMKWHQRRHHLPSSRRSRPPPPRRKCVVASAALCMLALFKFERDDPLRV